METIRQAQRRIEQEFDEPLRDVVAGFADMGHSMPLVAADLEVSVSSLKHFCSRKKIRFSRSPLEHREITGRPGRRIRHGNQEKSLTAWALDLGVAPSTVHKRMRQTGRPVR